LSSEIGASLAVFSGLSQVYFFVTINSINAVLPLPSPLFSARETRAKVLSEKAIAHANLILLTRAGVKQAMKLLHSLSRSRQERL
jgi:hypothetical protein